MLFEDDAAMILFSGVVDAASIRALREHIEGAGSREVILLIESPGGAMQEALKCADWIQRIQRSGKAITAIAVGAVDSAAIAIYAACEHRAVVSEGSFLFHRTEMGTDDLRGVRLTASSLGVISSRLGEMDKEFMKIISRATGGGLSHKRIRDLMNNEAAVSAREAFATGLAQKIVAFSDLSKSGP